MVLAHDLRAQFIRSSNIGTLTNFMLLFVLPAFAEQTFYCSCWLFSLLNQFLLESWIKRQNVDAREGLLERETQRKAIQTSKILKDAKVVWVIKLKILNTKPFVQKALGYASLWKILLHYPLHFNHSITVS